MKKDRQSKGRLGEEIAQVYLTEKGYVIREKNYRYRRSEIDLIAQHEQILVFFEVKFHENRGFGFPEESVSNTQQTKIVEAAEQYIIEVDWQEDIRFDIIAIQTHNDKTVSIQHFEDAFY